MKKECINESLCTVIETIAAKYYKSVEELKTDVNDTTDFVELLFKHHLLTMKNGVVKWTYEGFLTHQTIRNGYENIIKSTKELLETLTKEVDTQEA